MGAATVRAGGVVVFESPVQLSTTYGALPRGASLLLELRHFKKPKMSVKCWAAFDARASFSDACRFPDARCENAPKRKKWVIRRKTRPSLLLL